MFIDFKCTNKDCQKILLDEFVKLNTEHITCPECGSQMDRMMATPHFKFASKTERKYPTHLLNKGNTRANIRTGGYDNTFVR